MLHLRFLVVFVSVDISSGYITNGNFSRNQVILILYTEWLAVRS